MILIGQDQILEIKLTGRILINFGGWSKKLKSKEMLAQKSLGLLKIDKMCAKILLNYLKGE